MYESVVYLTCHIAHVPGLSCVQPCVQHCAVPGRLPLNSSPRELFLTARHVGFFFFSGRTVD